MSDAARKRAEMAEAGQRAIEKLPAEIRLGAAPQHAWSNRAAIEAHSDAFRTLGFDNVRDYTVGGLPGVAVRFLLQPSERMYGVIYEHAKAGVWLNIVGLYEDGTSITFTSSKDRGIEQRPGHPIVYGPGAGPRQLHELAMQQRPAGSLKPLSAETIAGEFERAWAEGMRWRKSRGVSVAEVANVMWSGAGKPVRILATGRIQFIGDQDGAPESELKQRFRMTFDHHQSVEKAFLARVRYEGAAQPSVALCLVAASPKDTGLIHDIQKTFASVFRATTHLDMLFIGTPDLARLESACTAFYVRAIRPQ